MLIGQRLRRGIGAGAYAVLRALFFGFLLALWWIRDCRAQDLGQAALVLGEGIVQHGRQFRLVRTLHRAEGPSQRRNGGAIILQDNVQVALVLHGGQLFGLQQALVGQREQQVHQRLGPVGKAQPRRLDCLIEAIQRIAGHRGIGGIYDTAAA